MEKLKELLDLLSCGGFETEFNFPSQQFLKESNWYELPVGGSEEDFVQSKMSKQERDYQEAVWELLKSELLYMEKLKVLSEVFLNTLEEIQKEGLLTDVSIERLFGNLRAVCQAHLTLWLEHLQPVLETARQNKQLINALDVCHAFLQIETLFEPHMTYIKDQESCTQYARSTYQTNEIFKVFVMWCESQKVCGRLKLTDLLVKPMQRLAQYPLLLQAILKNSSHDEEQCALKQALSCAQQFLAQVNSTLRLYSEQEKVFILNERLEAFDFFDFQNEDLCQAVEKFSKFDIISPPLGAPYSSNGCNSGSAMRKLLVEGPWRLKESSKGKMDVYAYLFVDVLILTKQSGNRKGGTSGGIPRLKPIHPPMGVSQLIVTPVASAGQDQLQNCGGGGTGTTNRNGGSSNCMQVPSISTGTFTVVYVNECSVAMSAFLVNVGSPSNAHVWISGINNAKKQFISPVPLSLDVRNNSTFSSCSIENSPNQRMSSKIANQIRTLFSPTALSTEDEDDVNSHSSASSLFMTPVNHSLLGGGSSPQEIPRNHRSIKKTSCDSPDNTSASKPFNSKSTPNLSVDLNYLTENNLLAGHDVCRAFSPCVSPPLSPMPSKKHSAGACTPLTLSPHLSDFGRKLMGGSSASVYNNNNSSIQNHNNNSNNNCYNSSNTSYNTGNCFFSIAGIPTSVPFTSSRTTSKSKFPLPRRKISDSAVPISYAYYNYNSVKCSCGSNTCSSTANSSPLGDIPDDSSSSGTVWKSGFAEFNAADVYRNPNNTPQANATAAISAANKDAENGSKRSMNRRQRKTSFLMPSPSRGATSDNQEKTGKQFTLSGHSILQRKESAKSKTIGTSTKEENKDDYKLESRSSEDISKTVLLISQLPNSASSLETNQSQINHEISINVQSPENEDC